MISMAARKLPLAAAFLVAAALMQAPDAVLSAVHLSGSPLASSICEVCPRIPPACAISAGGLLLVCRPALSDADSSSWSVRSLRFCLGAYGISAGAGVWFRDP